MSQTVIPKEEVTSLSVGLTGGGSQSVQFVLNNGSKRDETPKELRLEGDNRVWTLHDVFAKHHFDARRQSLAEMVEQLGPDQEPLVYANNYPLLATSIAVFGASRLPVEAYNSSQGKIER